MSSDLSHVDDLRYMLLDFDASKRFLRKSVILDDIRPVAITLNVLC